MYAILKEAYPHDVNNNISNLLKRISKECEICNEHSVAPFKFRAPMPEENITCQRQIPMNIMWINGN